MGRKEDKREYFEKLAKQYFGQDKSQLPPVEDLIIALEIAKGTRFRLNPGMIERVRETYAKDSKTRDDDWCWYCDDEQHGDKCSSNGCDALDCMPGLTPDS